MPQNGIHAIVGVAARKWMPKREWLLLGVVLGTMLEEHFFSSLVKADGNIRFVYKELPLLGPESTFAARAAIAAQGAAAGGQVGDAAARRWARVLDSLNAEPHLFML